MVNPRRSSYVSSGQSSENPFQTQSFSLSSILNLLKKPQAFPFLLSIFILLTWVSLKFQHSSHFSPLYQNPKKWSKDEDLKANLVRFLPSKLAKKDKRGWLLNPVAAALDAGISGINLSFQILKAFLYSIIYLLLLLFFWGGEDFDFKWDMLVLCCIVFVFRFM